MKKTRYIPYGYTMQNGTTVVEHSEAEVIRRIFESYINGNSLKDIADELTRLKVPYTEKTSVWDKARIARIIENAKYIGDREYAPIIDEEIYESAVQCKIARKTNQMRSDSETIRFLRDRVKCGECGYPMTRTLQSSCKIKERWTCTNPECGCRIRISDSVLIEKVTMLINRIIENSALLEPGEEHRKKDTPPSIQHMTEEIMAEAASPTGSEQLILDRIIEIAKERYRNSNIEKELALRIPKGVVCDKCNNYFARKIESPFLNSEAVLQLRQELEIPNRDGKEVNRFANLPTKNIMQISQDIHLVMSQEDKTEEEVERAVFEYQKYLKRTDEILIKPDYNLSRLLAKMAIEAFAYKCLDDGDVLDYIIEEEALKKIREYVRYGGSTESRGLFLIEIKLKILMILYQMQKKKAFMLDGLTHVLRRGFTPTWVQCLHIEILLIVVIYFLKHI